MSEDYQVIHCNGFSFYALADGTFRERRFIFIGKPDRPPVPYVRSAVPLPTPGPLTHEIAGVEKPKRTKKLRGVPKHVRR